MRLIFIIVLVASGCATQDGNLPFNRVVIHYVHRDITTFMSVDCNYMEGAFGKTLLKIDTTGADFIAKVKQSLVHDSYSTHGDLDVRTKIYLCQQDSIVATYCMDRGGALLLNNKTPIRNTAFAGLIHETIDANGYRQ